MSLRDIFIFLYTNTTNNTKQYLRLVLEGTTGKSIRKISVDILYLLILNFFLDISSLSWGTTAADAERTAGDKINLHQIDWEI